MNARTDPTGVDDLLEDISTLSLSSRSGLSSGEVARLREGEVRPAAVLFVELLGLDPISTQLESGQYALLLERIHEFLRMEAESHGGYCNDAGGNSALFIFTGDPAYPPARRGALRSALAMLDKIGQLGGTPELDDFPLGLRLGTSYGEIARQRVGGELRAVGDRLNLAQRLATSGEPGGLVCDEECLSGNRELFHWEGPERVELAGIGEFETYRITGERRGELALRGGRGELTPLTARDRELDRLADAALEFLEDESGSEPLALLLRGPSGVGKTRLARELLNALRESGDFPQTTVQTRRFGGGLLDLAEQLAGLAGFSRTDPDTALRRLFERSGIEPESGDELDTHAAVLEGLVNRAGGSAALELGDYASLQAALKSTLGRLYELVGASGRAPPVLVLDDLQWLDDPAGLIPHLLTLGELEHPPLVIGTIREEGEVPPELDAICRVEELELEPLDRELSRELIRNRLPGLTLPDHLWEQILDRAGGLPYFLEEFCNLLVEGGYVTRTPGGEWRQLRELGELSLPDDLRALALGRLDSLPAPLADTVRRASLQGEVFRTELLERVEAGLENVAGGDLATRLAELTELGILRPADPEALEPADAEPELPERFSFNSPNLREAAYSSLLSHNRRILHSLTADAVAALDPVDTMAGMDGLANLVEHLERAGRGAESLQRCLELLEMVAGTGRRELWEHNWERALRLLVEFGSELDSAGELPGFGELPEELGFLEDLKGTEGVPRDEALRLAVYRLQWLLQGEPETALAGAEALLDTLPQGAPEAVRGELELIAGKAANSLHRLESAETHLKTAIEVFGGADLEEELARSHAELGTTLWYQQDLAAAEDHYRDALELLDELGATWHYCSVLQNLGIICDQQDRPDEALDCYRTSLEQFRELGDVTHQAKGANNLAILYQHRRELGKAEEMIREHLRLSRRAGLTMEEGKGHLNLAGNLRLQHEEGGAELRREEIEHHYREAARVFGEVGYDRGRGMCLADLADFLTDRRELQQAETLTARARDLLEESGDRFHLAKLQAREARMLFLMDRADQAERQLERAREALDELEGLPESRLKEELEKTQAAMFPDRE